MQSPVLSSHPTALRVAMPLFRDGLDPAALMELALKALPELLSFLVVGDK